MIKEVNEFREDMNKFLNNLKEDKNNPQIEV